jgi:hypothetical protein
VIRARIPIHRHEDDLWHVGPTTVHVPPGRDIPVPAARPEASLEDVIETMMGETLYSLEKNGQRGTSDPIEWEIMVNDVPYCYRCVRPMVPLDHAETQRWECPVCHTSLQRQ